MQDNRHPDKITETHAIHADQWVDFFDGISRDHTGWLTSIEVLDADAGPQAIAANLPLQGFSFDIAGTRPSTLVISVGDQIDQHVNHVIELPLSIDEAEEAGGNIDIKIEPAHGPVTLVHLSGPIH